MPLYSSLAALAILLAQGAGTQDSFPVHDAMNDEMKLPPANPDTWHVFMKDRLGTTYAIRERDRGRVRDEGEVWIKLDHRLDRSEPYRETRLLNRLDCAASMIGQRATVRSWPDGRSSRVDEDAKMRAIVPDSIADGLQRVACAK